VNINHTTGGDLQPFAPPNPGAKGNLGTGNLGTGKVKDNQQASLALAGAKFPTQESESTAKQEGASNQKKPTSAEQMEEAVKAINQQIQQNGSELLLSVDQGSDRIVAKVINTQTKAVIRQIPSEETLALARNLKHSGRGRILETKV